MKSLWTRYVNSFRGLPGEAWTYAAVVLINRSGSMVLVFMTLYLTLKRGVSPADAAWTISLYGIGGMAGAMTGSWLTDRIGADQVQRVSLIFSGLFLILLGYLPTLLLIRIAMTVIGFLDGTFRPANAAAVGDACPEDQMTRGFALNRLAINIGSTIGPAIGGLLVLVSYRFLFWVDGLTCIAAGVVLAWTTRKSRHVPESEDAFEQAPARNPLKDGPFLAFWIVMLIYGMMFMQLLSTFPIFINQQLGFPESAVGFIFALNATLVVLVEMPLTTRLRHHSTLGVAMVGTLLFGIGFSLTPLGVSAPFIALTVLVWSMGEILSFPQFSAVVALRAGRSSRGRYMGLYTLSFSTALVLGPALGGLAYGTVGPRILYGAFLPLSLAMVLVLVTVARPMFPGQQSRPGETAGTGSA